MKSPMIQEGSFIKTEDKGNYSELQVLRSPAGWYIGTMYHDPEGFQEPGSRDSGYFATKKEAEDEFRSIEAGEAGTRMTP